MNRLQRMGRDSQTEGCSVISRNVSQPTALVAVGAASLLVFAAAGWSLGRMRASVPSSPAGEAVATVPNEPNAIARGRLVYQVHCSRCHGPGGRGDGTDAPILKTPPRDLAAVIATKTDDALRRSITEGIAATPMTGFAHLLSARELDSVVAFVRSLAIDLALIGSSDQTMPASLAENLKRAGFVPDVRRRLAPPLHVRAVDGKTTSLRDLRGSQVLVVFWGTSCTSCLDELPELEQLAARYNLSGLTVLPVCLDQTVATEAHTIAAAHTKSLSVYVDPEGFARLQYDVQGLPTAVLIDRDGRILGTAHGAKNWNDPAVHALLKGCLAVAR